MINPDTFVITRKRKKYKFAKFANSPLCFELNEWDKRFTDVIEVGAGTALFLVEQATLYPETRYVAIDVKADRLQKGAYEAMERGLTNISFLRARADQLADCFRARSLTTIWLTFADPFPKERSAGRRMSHPTFLSIYKALLKPDGTFILKHDSTEFFTWSLEQLVATNWHITRLTFDLHDSELPDEYRILTSYEARWLEEGKATKLVEAVSGTDRSDGAGKSSYF